MTDSLGARLVRGIAKQDPQAIADCFTDQAQVRALVPPGLRERTGAADAAGLIAGWFADSTELELLDSHTNEIGDKLHIGYRFTGTEHGQPYTVEQHLFCALANGKIDHADLLCSGFRPRHSN